VTGCLTLAALVAFIPEHKRADAYTSLGLEAIIVILSLAVVAVAVKQTPLVQWAAEYLRHHNGEGVIETTPHFVTTGISAAGAAMTLAEVTHRATHGTMVSAWQLACGICAGSSTLLTAASAGPIINAISRRAGRELTFKAYARFGLPFSVVMMAIYLAIN